MTGRRLALVLCVPLVVVLVFSLALAAKPRVTYAAAGTLSADRSSTTDCEGFDECTPSVGASGTASCGDACVSWAPSAGSFVLAAALRWPTDPNRLPLFPPNPCHGTGSGVMDFFPIDPLFPSDPVRITLSHVSLNSLLGRLTARGSVTSGALSGSRVRLRFEYPTDPMCPAGKSFSGSITFFPSNPL
jgi:hypothetical protein